MCAPCLSSRAMWDAAASDATATEKGRTAAASALCPWRRRRRWASREDARRDMAAATAATGGGAGGRESERRGAGLASRLSCHGIVRR